MADGLFPALWWMASLEGSSPTKRPVVSPDGAGTQKTMRLPGFSERNELAMLVEREDIHVDQA
jgi:hypothetical protein